MKKTLIAAMASTILAGSVLTATAEEIKIGVLLGFTGALESLVADMGPGAELAIKEISDSGLFLDGTTVKAIRGDTTCTDAAIATAAAEKLVTADGVKAIVGGDCSGVTGAALQNVARPNGIVMISPSATSPGLTTAEDDGLFFRTAPSDARQGKIVADILMGKGVKKIALTYTNNDYGKGLSDSIEANFKAAGGTVTIKSAHEDGKGDYSAEVGALAAAGGDVLVVAGYLDQGGKGIIQSAIDTGAFETFYLPDGMVGDALPAAIGEDLNGSYGAAPGTDSPGAAKFAKMATAAGFKAGPFAPESYDAAALILLAMQAAGSSESSKLKDKVFMVANAPGEKIYPGELSKALKILSDGGDIDYEGGSAVELIGPGESAGNYREIAIENGKLITVGYR
ncbi:MAG: branched-chain amino acid ABC transporter substrate-binding protein [Hyphomicrobiales bacterium]|nr:MAG: branched-chain amino acid ABC transporter substrate-binding protein [Hyphomicrobiales bacterium]